MCKSDGASNMVRIRKPLLEWPSDLSHLVMEIGGRLSHTNFGFSVTFILLLHNLRKLCPWLNLKFVWFLSYFLERVLSDYSRYWLFHCKSFIRRRLVDSYSFVLCQKSEVLLYGFKV